MKWPARHPTTHGALKAGLVVVSATLLGSCSSSENGASAVRDPATTAVEVVAAEAAVRPLGVDIEAVGTAAANESVEITSEISKKVTAIRFDEGDRVRRGEVLVELDSDEARAAVAEAEATLADAESQYQRSQNLFTREALSSAQLDQIESTLKASRARVQAARARLADTVIRAGFDGRTGLRRVSVGTLVGPNTVITTLDDDSLIKLNFTVPETVLFLVREGVPISAATPGIPGRRFEGRVTHLDSRVDPVTRSIVVRAELPNPDGLLRPGMFMTVTLQGDVVSALLVPEAAVVAERGRSFVFVVRDGAVERREVSTSRRRPGEVQITAGLEERERVVVEGTQNLRDGMRVVEQARSAAAGT
jgi:membrane fusion protein, multidrug efflux system